MTSAGGNRIDGRPIVANCQQNLADANQSQFSKHEGGALFILKRLLRLPRV
jgi:hypothetical protein